MAFTFISVFPSRHNDVSSLHKQNLDKWRSEHEPSSSSVAEMDSLAATFAYRDRAKERRLKYGKEEQEDQPSNRLKVT